MSEIERTVKDTTDAFRAGAGLAPLNQKGMSVSDTPETDAGEYDTGLRIDDQDADPDMVVPAKLARSLERRLRDALRQRDQQERFKWEANKRADAEQRRAEGMVLVPREPTEAMIRAGDFKGAPKAAECRCCVLTWRAMLAATQDRP